MMKGKEWVSPSFSNEVFERAGVAKVFFLVLLLVVIGKKLISLPGTVTNTNEKYEIR